MQQESFPMRNFLMVNEISSAAATALWATGLAGSVWQLLLSRLAAGSPKVSRP